MKINNVLLYNFFLIPIFYWPLVQLHIFFIEINRLEKSSRFLSHDTSCASGSEKLLAMYQKSPPKVLY